MQPACYVIWEKKLWITFGKKLVYRGVVWFTCPMKKQSQNWFLFTRINIANKTKNWCFVDYPPPATSTVDVMGDLKIEHQIIPDNWKF